MNLLPLLREKALRGWPKHENGARIEYRPVADVLSRPFGSDAHFAAYSAPELARRLTRDALARRDLFPAGIAMVVAVFDVDADAAHRAGGGTPSKLAPDTWWLAELEKVHVLLDAHPGAFVYRTRGGYRLVFRLEGLVLREPADAEAWAARYVAWVAYLRRAFGIVADAACHDWTRLFRAPRVVRDGRTEVRECIGNANAVGLWTCEPTAEDHELARSLRRQRRPRAHKPREERPAASVGEGVLFHALKARGALGHQADSGKWAIACPWAVEHTSGATFDTSTVLFAPSPGEELGWPHCSHAHCAARDLRDWLKTFSDEELSAARAAAGVPERDEPAPERAEDAASAPAARSRARRTITVDTDEHRVNDESIEALAGQADIYQRGGHLVEVLEVDGRRVIRELPLARIRERLAAAAEYIRIETDEETGELVEKRAHVPDWCVKAVACRGEWPEIPRLVGLLEAPALRPDGTVIQEPGLDRTGYLFMPGDDFPLVPESPTKGDALAARDALLEIVVDFPFATEAHRAAWLAFALTPFARPAFEGCTPIVAVDATTRGTGKGRLVDATANLALGRDASKTPQPKDDDEMRKRITSVLREAEPMHTLDNVSRRLEDASLDAVATSTMWKDRALGKNETFSLPNLTTWVVNGNNLDFGADTARRTLHIRLESKLENPEDRDDFAHPDLLGWVRAERPRLVAAALTLLRAYMVAGRPAMGCKAWGSFEGWSRLLANAVVWVEMSDPQSTRAELEEVSDTRKGALVALLDGWARLCRDVPAGLTAKAALELLYSADRLRGQATPDGFDDLREAIEVLVPTAPGKQPSSQKLGAQLRHFRRRVIGGRMFDGEKGHAGFFRWRVVSEQVSGAGEVGEDGEAVPNPSYARPRNVSSTPEGREGPEPHHHTHHDHPAKDGWIDFGEEVA